MWESKGATTLAKKIIIEEGTRRGRIKEKNLDYRARERGGRFCGIFSIVMMMKIK